MRPLLHVAGGPGGGGPCALALQWRQLSANHTSVFPQVCEERTAAASQTAVAARATLWVTLAWCW